MSDINKPMRLSLPHISPQIVVCHFFDSSDNPLTGLSPTFDVYIDDQNDAVTPPTITEIGGGAYKFLPVFSQGRALVYVVNPNAGGASNPSRDYGFLRPEDFGVDTLLNVALGQWEIVTTGADANRMVFTDQDGNVIAKFDLTDDTGMPVTTGVFKRSPA